MNYIPPRSLVSLHAPPGAGSGEPERHASPFHRDAALAISQLGEIASVQVTTGVWLHLGAWLGWPVWLCEGTSQRAGHPLPVVISAADDLVITANVLDRLGPAELLVRLMEHQRPALGPRAALLYGSAPSVGDALTSICEASINNNPYIGVEVNRRSGALVLTAKGRVALGSLTDILESLMLLIFFKIAQSMASGMDMNVRLETSLPAAIMNGLDLPPERCRIIPDASRNRLVLPAELAAQDNPESDPGMWILARESFRHLSSTQRSGSIASRIRKRVVRQLGEGGSAPRLKQIAADEGLSSRTIIRMLTEEGTSFFELMEQERRRLAVELVNDPALSLEEIAARLGFADTSSFGRSFRKWFGMPPGQFRKHPASAD